MLAAAISATNTAFEREHVCIYAEREDHLVCRAPPQGLLRGLTCLSMSARPTQRQHPTVVVAVPPCYAAHSLKTQVSLIYPPEELGAACVLLAYTTIGIEPQWPEGKTFCEYARIPAETLGSKSHGAIAAFLYQRMQLLAYICFIAASNPPLLSTLLVTSYCTWLV